MVEIYEGYKTDHRLLRQWVVNKLGRFVNEKSNKKGSVEKLYFNPEYLSNEPLLAHRICTGGLMTGLTSKSREWFAIQPSDPSVKEDAPIQEAMVEIKETINNVLVKSNFYDSTFKLYADLTLFGQGCMLIERSLDEDVINCHTFPQGSYFTNVNDKGYINRFARKLDMDLLQIVEKFGVSGLTEDMKTKYDAKDYSEPYTIVHIIFPNINFIENPNLRTTDNEKFKFTEYYYVEAEEDSNSAILKEGGYNDFPVMFPRWETIGNDVYASGSPAIDCLGICMQLQSMEKSKLDIVELLGDPPTVAPTGSDVNKYAGGITYIDEEGEGVRNQVYPLFAQQPNIQPITEDINRIENAVNRSFYVDLFSSLLSMPVHNMTAREVQERHEEKMLLLGSVLERITKEFLDPAISRIYSILLEENIIKEEDYEGLKDIDWQPEYVSILHESMKANRADDSKERFLQFVMQYAQAEPTILKAVKPYSFLKLFAKDLGIGTEALASEIDYEQIVSDIESEMKAQSQLEQANEMATIAKTASEAKNEDGTSILDTINEDEGV